jgi:general secretion pathway protein B
VQRPRLVTPAPAATLPAPQARSAASTPAAALGTAKTETAVARLEAVPAKAESNAARAPAAALPLFSELPAATRQELPAISLGGYIYSARAAERSILINGKLLREGDSLAPGLRLEQMRPDGVVFGYKDLRFRMNY